MQNYKEALIYFENAISINSKNGKYFYFKGKCLYELKMKNDAMYSFDKAIQSVGSSDESPLDIFYSGIYTALSRAKQGSLLFGNSYSHYFKKVRIRRLTNKKPSITSLAIGAQKASLAILDKEGDKDMKTRIILTPFIYFGPLMFLPIIIIGVLLDIFLFNFSGVASVIAAVLGLALYVISFVMSLMVLKTEVKAQGKALEILEKDNLANEEEREMMKSLFKLYNIQYVNDLILEFLELLLRILMIFARMQSSSSSSSRD